MAALAPASLLVGSSPAVGSGELRSKSPVDAQTGARHEALQLCGPGYRNGGLGIAGPGRKGIGECL